MTPIRSILKTKKGLIPAVLLSVLLLALIITGILHIKGCADTGRMTREREECLNKAAEGLDRYNLDMIIRPEDGSIALTEEITFTNRTDETLDSIVLRTWAGAFSQEDTSPAAIEDIFGSTYGTSFSAGSIRTDGAWTDGKKADCRFEDDACTVLRVEGTHVEPGQTVKLLLRFSLTVPECAYRYGRTGELWQLGNFIPLIAVRENDEWVTDGYYPIGDPFRSECADFDLKVTLPEEYTLLCSAPVTKNGNVWTGSLKAARDIAMTAGKGLILKETKVNGIRIISAARDREAADEALKYAAGAMKTYESLYGMYPYPTLTLVQCDLPFDGMAYPALIMLGRDRFSNDEELETAVARQCAQQWFSVLVGTDGYTDPWQDEAVSEFAMLNCMEKLHGEEYRQHLIRTRVESAQRENIPSEVTPGSPVDYFTYLTDYTSVVYDRGCAVLLSVDMITDRGMNGFLKRYCEVYAFRQASRSDFEQLLNEFFGMDLRPLLADLDFLS